LIAWRLIIWRIAFGGAEPFGQQRCRRLASRPGQFLLDDGSADLFAQPGDVLC